MIAKADLLRKLEAAVVDMWYGSGRIAGLASTLLSPLTPVYLFFARHRKIRQLSSASASASPFPVPVVVVGNLTVGGTGKTPVILALVKGLRDRGFTAGVVSRGYGGSWTKKSKVPTLVEPGANPDIYGDEPVLIASQAGAPVAICANRVAAVEHLLKHAQCDVVLSDDGLQHYSLYRDFELVVVDGKRGFGNGKLLPAGPLREPVGRLASVDVVLVNGSSDAAFLDSVCSPPLSFEFENRVIGLRQLGDESGAINPLSSLASAPVHAVTGIGNPQRFFDSLLGAGLEIEQHALPDHHRFQPADLQFGDRYPIVMTSKDAIKCQRFLAQIAVKVYVLDIEPVLPQKLWTALEAKCQFANTQ